MGLRLLEEVVGIGGDGGEATRRPAEHAIAEGVELLERIGLAAGRSPGEVAAGERALGGIYRVHDTLRGAAA